MEVFESICMLLGGIAVFLLGMKLMSDGLDAGAGKSIKKLFARIGDNRLVGVGIGAGTTAIIQSSSATSVMVVGFVNAGVMTLFQAAAIIMGANIGTTLTAFLGVLGDLPIAPFFMASGVAGVFLYMFAKKKKVSYAGEIITGFSIVFVGMSLMSSAFRSSETLTAAFTDLFSSLSQLGVGPLLLLLLGGVFTGLIQSSSVTTVMVVNMVLSGIIPLQAALFIILGANIGTCVTALIASIGTSINARRAAFIHLFFNLFGTLLILPFLWIFNMPITSFFAGMAGGNMGLAASFFHLCFNIVTVGALIGFIRPLVKLVTKVVPGQDEQLDEPHMFYIDVPAHAELENMELINKEIINMAALTRKNIGAALEAVINVDTSKKNKISNTERMVNFINRGIGRFLVKQSEATDSKRINSLHYVTSDIERIADHAMDFLNQAEDMHNSDSKFSKTAASDLKDMFSMVDEMFAESVRVFETRDLSSLSKISAIEKEIYEKKHTLEFGHIERLNKGICSVDAGAYFYAMISGLERIADYLAGIAFSVRESGGYTLEQLKAVATSKAKKRSMKSKIYW